MADFAHLKAVRHGSGGLVTTEKSAVAGISLQQRLADNQQRRHLMNGAVSVPDACSGCNDEGCRSCAANKLQQIFGNDTPSPHSSRGCVPAGSRRNDSCLAAGSCLRDGSCCGNDVPRSHVEAAFGGHGNSFQNPLFNAGGHGHGHVGGCCGDHALSFHPWGGNTSVRGCSRGSTSMQNASWMRSFQTKGGGPPSETRAERVEPEPKPKSSNSLWSCLFSWCR